MERVGLEVGLSEGVGVRAAVVATGVREALTVLELHAEGVSEGVRVATAVVACGVRLAQGDGEGLRDWVLQGQAVPEKEGLPEALEDTEAV